MSEAFIRSPSHFELVFVGLNGTDTHCFGYQPCTEDIGERRRGYSYCIQLVGDTYEVYDLATFKEPSYRSGFAATIGLPVFEHKDADAAIMWALMNL